MLKEVGSVCLSVYAVKKHLGRGSGTGLTCPGFKCPFFVELSVFFMSLMSQCLKHWLINGGTAEVINGGNAGTL